MGKLENKGGVIIVRLQGGLGNQMFQYAAATALADKYKSPVSADVSGLEQTRVIKKSFTPREYALGIFKNIDATIASHKTTQSFRKASDNNGLLKKLGLSRKTIYNETAFCYDDAFFLQRPPVLLNGYFQSEKYFLKISQTIRQQFSFPDLPDGDVDMPVLQHIKKVCAVSVHVRRGDYVNDKATNAVHGACSIDYYTKAFAYMQQHFADAVFVFFSDDPAWVRERFIPYLPGSILVENNTAANSWKDMYLMSKCRHHIIANSSFSWWGAWLNESPGKKIIAPKIWFADAVKNKSTTDLVPENWARI